jgi:rhodanese-related sulfurtransferase
MDRAVLLLGTDLWITLVGFVFRKEYHCFVPSVSYHDFGASVSLPIEVTPQEVQRRLNAGEKLFLVDVREPSEFAQARLAAAELVPMRTVPAELSRLDASADEGTLIVFCHHGVRSLNVVNWLREQGVSTCQSMAGGIDRWSREIDPTVPRYS